MAYTHGNLERDWLFEKDVQTQLNKSETISDVSLTFAKHPLTGDVVIKIKQILLHRE